MINFDWEAWLAEVDKFEDELNRDFMLTTDEALGYLARMPKEMQDMLHGNMSFGDHTYIAANILLRVLTVLPVTVCRPYVFRLCEGGKSATILVLKDDMHLLFTIDDSSHCKYSLTYTECSPAHGVEINGGAHVTKKRGRAQVLKKILGLLEN